MTALMRDTAVHQLLQMTLLASDAVQAICGSRVSAGYSEDPDAGTAALPRLAFEVDGGKPHLSGVFTEYAVTLWALGATSDQAQALHQEAHGAWQGECVAVDGLDHRGRIRLMRAGRTGYWSGTACWYVTSAWELQVVRDTP